MSTCEDFKKKKIGSYHFNISLLFVFLELIILISLSLIYFILKIRNKKISMQSKGNIVNMTEKSKEVNTPLAHCH